MDILNEALLSVVKELNNATFDLAFTSNTNIDPCAKSCLTSISYPVLFTICHIDVKIIQSN